MASPLSARSPGKEFFGMRAACFRLTVSAKVVSVHVTESDKSDSHNDSPP